MGVAVWLLDGASQKPQDAGVWPIRTTRKAEDSILSRFPDGTSSNNEGSSWAVRVYEQVLEVDSTCTLYLLRGDENARVRELHV